MVKAKNIDEYITGFPEGTRQALEQIRAIVHREAPEAKETISYNMPAFALNGTYLVYFAGYKNHIGFYPAPVAHAAFKKELAQYKTGKGSVQFPLSKPMPEDLVTRLVRHSMKENKARTNSKKGI